MHKKERSEADKKEREEREGERETERIKEAAKGDTPTWITT